MQLKAMLEAIAPYWRSPLLVAFSLLSLQLNPVLESAIASELNPSQLNGSDVDDQAEILGNVERLYNENFCNRCDLSNQNLDGFDLISTTLRWSNLSYSSFQRTDLVMANLSHVNLQYANLERADLTRAVLVGADLTHARLMGANLENADLSKANFNHTNFMNANLKNAVIDIEAAVQSGAFFCGATLPDGTLGPCN